MKITQKSVKLAVNTLRCVYIIVITVIIIKLELSVLKSILLLLGLSFIVVYDLLLIPIVKYLQKTTNKKNKIIDKHIKIAEKQDKKRMPCGKDNKHIVWAKNTVTKDKLYHLHIAPKLQAHPHKVYWYVSAECNNLND